MTPAFFHREREGFFQRLLLLPLDLLSLAYRLALRLYMRRYETGRAPRSRPAVPVISVGNLVLGGAGKTPVVLHLAEALASRGRRVAILSLGYGRQDQEERRVERGDPATLVGDEPLLLARRLPEARVYVGQRRDRLARRAVEEGADVLLLDDGFQYLALERDLDLVVLDGASPLGNGRLLPRGPLREPPAALSRAQLCWLSKVDEGREDSLERATRLAVAHTGVDPIRSRYRVAGVFHADFSSPMPRAGFRDMPVFLFAGLARPASFRKTVATLGMRIVGTSTFADHAFISPRTLDRLFARAERAGARHLVCTEKDAVRLPASLASDPRVLVVRIEVEIVSGQGTLDAALDRLLAEGRAA